MGRRGDRGRAPDHAKREAFAKLIAEGVPSARACRMVGIHPRTGKRWRNGRRITSGGRAAEAPAEILLGLRRRQASRNLRLVCVALAVAIRTQPPASAAGGVLASLGETTRALGLHGQSGPRC